MEHKCNSFHAQHLLPCERSTNSAAAVKTICAAAAEIAKFIDNQN